MGPGAVDGSAPSSESRRNSPSVHCPSSLPSGSCLIASRRTPAAPGSPRSHTGCHDPNDEADPGLASGALALSSAHPSRVPGSDTVALAPPDHFAVAKVQNPSQIQPALIRRDRRHVRGPNTIRALHRKPPPKDVLGHEKVMPRVRCHHEPLSRIRRSTRPRPQTAPSEDSCR